MTFVTVAEVAQRLEISERRVRKLLLDGRMAGRKQDNGNWTIYWPLSITAGKRGPEIKNYPSRLKTKRKNNSIP